MPWDEYEETAPGKSLCSTDDEKREHVSADTQFMSAVAALSQSFGLSGKDALAVGTKDDPKCVLSKEGVQRILFALRATSCAPAYSCELPFDDYDPISEDEGDK